MNFTTLSLFYLPSSSNTSRHYKTLQILCIFLVLLMMKRLEKHALCRRLFPERLQNRNIVLLAGALFVVLVMWMPSRTHSAPLNASRKSPSNTLPTTFVATHGKEAECRVKLLSTCSLGRSDVSNVFTSIYKTAGWGTSSSSHTRSGSGSTMKGAFETIVNLEPKFRELNITSIADVPSGDCGWQFALTTINAADAYFGGDITPHVAQENAKRFQKHLNKAFAFWDLVECPIPQWHTTCDSTPRHFDIVIVRDVIQHMTVNNAMKALKSIVEQSGASYIAVTSFSSVTCTDQCSAAILSDGGFYHNNLHCPPWNFPQPFFKFKSHDFFPEEADYMELYRTADVKNSVAAWPETPCPVHLT